MAEYPVESWEELSRLVSIIGRRVTHAYRRLAWALKNKPMTDEEKFALKLAERHIREGCFDLAEEDLQWLGRRIDGDKHLGFTPAS